MDTKFPQLFITSSNSLAIHSIEGKLLRVVKGTQSQNEHNGTLLTENLQLSPSVIFLEDQHSLLRMDSMGEGKREVLPLRTGFTCPSYMKDKALGGFLATPEL